MFCSTEKAIVKKLEACLIAFSPESVTNILKNFKRVICNFTLTNQIIKQLQGDVQSQLLLENFKALNKMDIVDILIMPVQRPPRYVLLLNECIKLLGPGLATKCLSDRVNYLQKWILSINYHLIQNNRA